MDVKKKARELLRQFKGDKYASGSGVLERTGEFAAAYGRTALLVSNDTYFKTAAEPVLKSLQREGIELAGGEVTAGSRPNSPREDVYRLQGYILHYQPEVIIAIGGGSTIDACKAAAVLADCGRYSPDIESYFGSGQVTAALQQTGQKLRPIIAVQTSSSSAAHLTRYANVTDPEAGQKKLIVDEAVIPPRAVFDYRVTATMPAGLTADGASDGLAHTLEVFYGTSEDKYQLTAEITAAAVKLIVDNTERAVQHPDDYEAREALGLATDLGGYAIMTGGTNGGHLTSFSLVDVTSHGRACGILNPYYTVFFAPAVEPQLRVVGEILKEAGFITTELHSLRGRELGTAVARGMLAFNESIGFPTRLTDLSGFSRRHIDRALEAAKNPQLEMKLKNMPIPLQASQVDKYMRPILEAAAAGDLSLIRDYQSA